MAEVITRKYEKGALVSEEVTQVDWTPNEADMDIVLVRCECGNEFDMPWDVVAFGGLGEGSFCGQCGEEGKMQVVADPSPKKGGA